MEVKDHLVRYLGHRAVGAAWADDFRQAATTYLQDHTDVSLHGIMVRDVCPNDLDLRTRCTALAKKRPTATSIVLRAIYLPKGAIKTLPSRADSAAGGRG